MTLENSRKVEVPQQEWHALEAEEVLNHLKVQEHGLTSEEAKKRLEHYGPNQLEEAPRPTFLQMLWEQLNNFVVILLIIASVISALLGDYVEASAIMAISLTSPMFTLRKVFSSSFTSSAASVVDTGTSVSMAGW